MSFFVACTSVDKKCVDFLNDKAYQYHYRNLDSTRVYAQRAISHADGYSDGYVEALNNLAFVCIAKMNYHKAYELLSLVYSRTDNLLEQLVSDIQMMRLCQRQSENRKFYHYLQHADYCLNRLGEDSSILSARQQFRLGYARSEYAIVLSTYLYYIGQHDKSAEALKRIDGNGEIVKDTAQLLAYYYNIGAGGILTAKTKEDLQQDEFDYLMRCYLLSRQYHYPYWEANSMQALSEHLQQPSACRQLTADNVQEIDFLNVDEMPDSLLAGNLAQRALHIFEGYGDVYQTAGAWRTLSEAYRILGDNGSAYICLDNALNKDTIINAAPDLVASIREQLSIVCAAIGDKQQSDYNRNLYLDLQERTRQDRQLEARVDLLQASLRQMDIMMAGVLLMIVLIGCLLAYSVYLRHKNKSGYSDEKLLEPFDKWKANRDKIHLEEDELIETLNESISIERSKLERVIEKNVCQRAKMSMASSVIPLINRLVHETKAISAEQNTYRYGESVEYMRQIVDMIERCNGQLTTWIKLRQGDLMLSIRSFALQPLFDTIAGNSADFRNNGIMLNVQPSAATVKADPTLTLFMLNTLIENARRYTPMGGEITVKAKETDLYVELSVCDNGAGMSQQKLSNLFVRHIIKDEGTSTQSGGHGFGLVNCKGIIEKYRKLSSLFDVCTISAESQLGKGSRFFFRLPKGMAGVVAALVMALQPLSEIRAASVSDSNSLAHIARNYADSAYYSNIDGHYERTVQFADSCLRYMNMWNAVGGGKTTKLQLSGNYPEMAADLMWFRDSIKANYGTLLDIRNETAIAALALNRWGLYHYNNYIYTQLFRECSSDNTISVYVQTMQKAETNRSIAIALLVILFLCMFPVYYMSYYRYRMYGKLCIGKIKQIGDIIEKDDSTPVDKKKKIECIWGNRNAAVSKSSFILDRDVHSQLDRLVGIMTNGLEMDAAMSEAKAVEKDTLQDELRSLQMTYDKYYVSNNVLENNLSALKHETMYYPSRLRHLLGDKKVSVQNMTMLHEVASYYQMLYTSFMVYAADAQKGIESKNNLVCIIGYLLAILKGKNKGVRPKLYVNEHSDGYVVIEAELLLADSHTDCSVLFSLQTNDFDYLVCSQIMRDIGEITGKWGCGISACTNENGGLTVKMKMPQMVWNIYTSCMK